MATWVTNDTKECLGTTTMVTNDTTDYLVTVKLVTNDITVFIATLYIGLYIGKARSVTNDTDVYFE